MKILLFLLAILSYSAFGQSPKKGEYDSIEAALKNPKAAKSLFLSEQKLKVLPKEVSTLNNLTEVTIDSNPGLDLEQAIAVLQKLPKLKSLSLTEDSLSDLPNSISHLQKLEYLWLNDNLFTKIPNSIKQMKQLRYVSFFSNQIKNIQLSEGDLPNLIQINLCYNDLNMFPSQLSTLSKLERVVAWGSSIDSIPESIDQMKRLRILNLELNNIKYIPKTLPNLRNLHTLTIWNNNLTAASIEPLYQARNLRHLDIRQNDIKFISNKINKLHKLTNLNISSNPIEKLPSGFIHLRRLQQLGIGELSQLNWDETFAILAKLPALRRVGIYSMKRRTMPDSFGQLRQVRVFWLTFNSFNSQERQRIRTLLPNADITFD